MSDEARKTCELGRAAVSQGPAVALLRDSRVFSLRRGFTRRRHAVCRRRRLLCVAR